MSSASLRALAQANKQHGYDVTLADTQDVLAVCGQIATARDLALNGLQTMGGLHKQWYLERILEALGVDLDKLKEVQDWQAGIAP